MAHPADADDLLEALRLAIAGQPLVNRIGQALELRDHAIRRMAQRGITAVQVQHAISNGLRLTRTYKGFTQTGYYDYDLETKVLVIEQDRRIVTILLSRLGYVRSNWEVIP